MLQNISKTEKSYRWSERSHRSWDQITKWESGWEKASTYTRGKWMKTQIFTGKKKNAGKRSSEKELLESWGWTTVASQVSLCSRMAAQVEVLHWTADARTSQQKRGAIISLYSVLKGLHLEYCFWCRGISTRKSGTDWEHKSNDVSNRKPVKAED